MHQGAIMNIKVCRDRYNPEEVNIRYNKRFWIQRKH